VLAQTLVESAPITTKLMVADNGRNTRMYGWLVNARGIRLREVKVGMQHRSARCFHFLGEQRSQIGSCSSFDGQRN
jgi:hypothetical protein